METDETEHNYMETVKLLDVIKAAYIKLNSAFVAFLSIYIYYYLKEKNPPTF